MKVREATPEDAASVQAVSQAAWHTAHDHILGETTVEQLLEEWYDQSGLKERIAREEDGLGVLSRPHVLAPGRSVLVMWADASPHDAILDGDL